MTTDQKDSCHQHKGRLVLCVFEKEIGIDMASSKDKRADSRFILILLNTVLAFNELTGFNFSHKCLLKASAFKCKWNYYFVPFDAIFCFAKKATVAQFSDQSDI